MRKATVLLGLLFAFAACGKGGDSSTKVSPLHEELLTGSQVQSLLTQGAWCREWKLQGQSGKSKCTFDGTGVFTSAGTVCMESGGMSSCGTTSPAPGTWRVTADDYLEFKFNDTPTWSRFKVYQISAPGETMQVRLKTDTGIVQEYTACLP